VKRLISLAAALLAGCTVGPDYRPPAPATPERFAGSTESNGPIDAELAGWWSLFGDAQLNELVNRALAQNLDVEMAAARIREARAREIVTGAAALPQVNAQGSVTRERISENAIPVPPGASGSGGTGFGLPGEEFTSWRAGFDASWELDLFGRNRREREAARGRTGAAIWNRRDVQLSVAAEVADAYLSLRTLQQRIATAGSEVARQERALELVRARVRGGLVTGQDLAQQSSELATAKATIPPLRAQANMQIHKIGVLTGASPEALLADLSPAGALLPSPPQVPAGLPSDLLRRRPDIRAAERELAASTADIGVATADLYPRFSLTAAPALVSTALASLLEWGSRSFSVAAAVDWPVFNGGRTRGAIAVANARQSQALIAYRKSVLTALQDVEDSLSRTDADRSQLGKLETALQSAGRAEDLARTRYRGGLVTLSDVLAAQQRRLSLENQVIETRGALGRDTVALFKAMGGGWPELGQGEAAPAAQP
jgi:multidrug efflux system outer membrane protein